MSRPRTEGERPAADRDRSLRDEVASLRIERDATAVRPGRSRGGRGPGALLLWLIPLGMLAGAGYFGYNRMEQLRPKREVEVASVQRMTVGEAEKLLSAKGYLQSCRQAAVGTKIPGRIARLMVDERSEVRKGDLIAVLEHNELDAALRTKRAMIERARAELQEAKADKAEKERSADRVRRLRSSNVATIEELDKAIAGRDMASARVEALEAGIGVLEAEAAEVEESVRNMQIIAPFDGTVVSLDAQLGETVNTMSLGTSGGRSAIVTIADLAHLEVETDVAESLLSRIAPGQPAEIAVGAVPGRTYRGRLSKIIPQGDRSRGTVKVEVEILDPDDRLFPELAATVHFLPDSSVDNPDAGRTLMFVDKRAIIDEGGHTVAWVVDDRGRLRKRRVEVVVNQDDLARIEAGLEAGEAVVVGPPAGLNEGEEVRVAD
ncbi:efflux RND transporter periplasmic adaptor subunit [Tautonia plasticadhaerens]|uniref:Macrolide export protein MacA n=1 Tax=Tautonia plasticadhaerens TaxID=2527974 RepID=A0A518HEU3_9BACT|nr:efflux RND transporter periplasmic adaptor subunit [Tautonia plasticadhaerens]QDV39351.1 Macrolide export protein MacA [Tautonia plasticadhaerens]